MYQALAPPALFPSPSSSSFRPSSPSASSSSVASSLSPRSEGGYVTVLPHGSKSLSQGEGEGKTIAIARVVSSDEIDSLATALNVSYTSHEDLRAESMPISDWLRSIPDFLGVARSDLNLLESACITQIFHDGDDILAHDQHSQFIHVIRDGNVKVLNDNKTVMTLTRGDLFGEVNVTNKTKGSSARYLVDGNVRCVSIPCEVYEQVLTGEAQLMGTKLSIDATNNDEVYSLSRHIDQFSELLQLVFIRTRREAANFRRDIYRTRSDSESSFGEPESTPFDTEGGDEENDSSPEETEIPRRPSASNANRRGHGSFTSTVESMFPDLDVSNEALMLDLLTAFTPELSLDDVLERIAKVTREVFCVNVVSVFLVDKQEMIVKVSTDIKGVRIPMTSLCGHVAKTGETLNAVDAYEDARFDPSMDLASSFRTKQVLLVPVFDPENEVCAVIQLANTVDDLPFTEHDEQLLFMVGEQLGQVLAKHDIATAFDSTLKTKFTSISEVNEPFSVCIHSASITKDFSVANKEHRHLRCTAHLFHGGVQLGAIMSGVNTITSREERKDGAPITTAQFGGSWLESSGVSFKNLPHATRIIFQLYSSNDHPCGWTGINLFEFDHRLKEGRSALQLWPGSMVPNATALQRKTADAHLTCMEVEFVRGGKEAKPIIYRPLVVVEDEVRSIRSGKSLEWCLARMPEAQAKRVKYLIFDPTAIPAKDDFDLIYNLRLTLMSVPEALSTLLLTIDWMNPVHVAEIYRLLYAWETLDPLLALQILDHRFPDPRVRAYAVQCLGVLSDSELRKYILQLTQTLKFESFHDSALSRFIIRRALSNPPLIGHFFFWMLKAEMHEPEVRERFGVLLDLYLRNCGNHRLVLGHQLCVMKRLEMVASKVSGETTKEERLKVMREQLMRCDFPDEFQLPLNPDMRARGIKVEKCRVMDSKTKPLWLVFEDADDSSKEIVVMFKTGDDLRQDQLTLQILGVMDGLWQDEGLDSNMSCYSCVCTGKDIGMVEVVTNSMTLAGIVQEGVKSGGGSMRRVAAAFDAFGNDQVLLKWLKSHNGNGEDGTEEEWADAKDRFMTSCASYCVATFVLGIGDRHNDNIMMKRTGELFHIDFGHFLGNFTTFSKFKVKREKAPFVFTAAMAALLDKPGSDTYKRFEDLCCECLLILRKQAGLLLTLLNLMLSCGIPELREEKDIDYFKDRLMLEMDDFEVRVELKKKIEASLKCVTTNLNDAIHIFVHTS